MTVSRQSIPSRSLYGILPVSVGLAVLGLALGRIHIRAQNTLIGYEIGRLKAEESRMLEDRSYLKMQLAKLTTRKHLMLMSDAESDAKHSPGTIALK
jgi:hypothetical protein